MYVYKIYVVKTSYEDAGAKIGFCGKHTDLQEINICFNGIWLSDFMIRWWRWISLCTGSRGRGGTRSSVEAQQQSCGNSLNALWQSIFQPRLLPRSPPCCKTASTSKPPAPPCWFSSAWATRALNTSLSPFPYLNWRIAFYALCQVSLFLFFFWVNTLAALFFFFFL